MNAISSASMPKQDCPHEFPRCVEAARCDLVRVDGAPLPAATSNIRNNSRHAGQPVGVNWLVCPKALRLLLQLPRNLRLQHNDDMFNALQFIKFQLFRLS